MKSQFTKLVAYFGGSRIKVNEPLKLYTSLKIGGPADYFVRVFQTKELVKAIEICQSMRLPYFILGGGTNILVSDKGFRGLVIKNETSQIRLLGLVGQKKAAVNKNSQIKRVYLETDSGVGVNRLVRNCLEQGFSGLEFFLGQPGTVGGAIYINAHNVNMNKFFEENLLTAKIYQADKGVVEVGKRYFRFGYDQSIIQKTKDIVLSVIFELEVSPRQKLWEKAKQAFEYRQKTQPKGNFSAGCVFRNIKKSQAHQISTPSFTCSAGYLLESAGVKDKHVGGAYISNDHANFILNKGDATAADVLELITLGKFQVKRKFGIDLQLEIVLVGEF